MERLDIRVWKLFKNIYTKSGLVYISTNEAAHLHALTSLCHVLSPVSTPPPPPPAPFSGARFGSHWHLV